MYSNFHGYINRSPAVADMSILHHKCRGRTDPRKLLRKLKSGKYADICWVKTGNHIMYGANTGQGMMMEQPPPAPYNWHNHYPPPPPPPPHHHHHHHHHMLPYYQQL
ncbi:hypothetical protein LWI28_026853 [Acer negundo]|uniref:Uncharacterized protein n=1 Tax=Acer negundo TaxID=4023 RepID=A0AAD5J707_ACENE|nr:hypothetical protein LWI28_026853 [Acer negundo]